jgi:hypothetical protein
VQAVEVGPFCAVERSQSPFDLFLIFTGANFVATTLLERLPLLPSAPGTRSFCRATRRLTSC